MRNNNPNIEMWDNVANAYDIEISGSEKELAGELIKVIKETGIYKGAKLIEIGCGSGHLSAILAQEGYNVTLLDFSKNALDKAKECFENLGIEGNFIEEDLFNLENINEEYDLVWNSGVMEHFDDENLKKALRSITSINAKYYMFSVPNAESLPYLLMRYKAISTGEWIWGKEYLRIDYDKFIKNMGCELFNIKYMGETFAQEHLQYAVQGCINNFDMKKLIMDKTISKNQSYLKTYIFTKSKDIYKNNINFAENNMCKDTEYKTEIFDLKGELNKYSILYNSAEEKQRKLINEKNALIKKLNENKFKIKSLETGLEVNIDEIEKLSKALKNGKINTDEMIKILNSINSKLVSIAHTNPFRLAYFMRRFKHEFIKGNGQSKKNFLKWIAKKFLRKESQTEYEYNLLMNMAIEISNYIDEKNNDLSRSVEQIENTNIETKTKKSVFIFASVPYYDIGGGQRSAQLAKTFTKIGYNVNYIYAYEASDGSNKQDIFIPCSIHKNIKEINEKHVLNMLTEDNIFIFELPHIECEKYLDIANRYNIPVIYEHIDNWETSLGNMFFNIETYRKFINKSNILIATSKLLQERLEVFINTDDGIIDKNKKVEYLANAVDSELFEYMIQRKEPSDLVKGEKTILYYGSLWGEWFDWDIIRHVANEKPEFCINLIGDYQGIKDLIKTLPSNVHFLGLKKQIELPAYLKHSDIAIIPFKNDEIGKYVSPLKIFEYICSGKVVVSTALPDIQSYPNVYCSDDKEDWVKFMSGDYKIKEFDSFICENNWYSRCRYIIDKAYISEEEKSISVIVLNRNNKKVIERCVQSLIRYNSYKYEIIVVDNQSTDGSFEMLQDKFGEKIKLIKNDKNGCSSGRNLGVKNSKGNHIVFLDSDQWILDYNWMDNAMEIIDSRKEIGAVGWNAGWFDVNSVQGPIVDYFPNRAMGIDKKFRTDIAYLATSGFVMKKSLFEKIGGFDEYYDPTCFEDTDLSLKIRYEGYEIAYCPYMSIFHLPHQTTKSGSMGHSDRMKKNGEYFMNKWNKLNPKLLQYYYKEW